MPPRPPFGLACEVFRKGRHFYMVSMIPHQILKTLAKAEGYLRAAGELSPEFPLPGNGLWEGGHDWVGRAGKKSAIAKIPDRMISGIPQRGRRVWKRIPFGSSRERGIIPSGLILPQGCVCSKICSIHLMVLSYWPSRAGRESPKLSLLVLPLVGFRAHGPASCLRGGQWVQRGREWELEKECGGFHSQTQFPVTQRGPGPCL